MSALRPDEPNRTPPRIPPPPVPSGPTASGVVTQVRRGSAARFPPGDTSEPGRTAPQIPVGARTPPPTAGLNPAALVAIPGYEIGAEIARGGMGVVLAARDPTLDREVAIKTLLPGTDGSGAVRRFRTEARVTAKLPHPGVPPVYAVGTLADGRPFMAMKLVRGRTLAAILAARRRRPPSPSADELDLTAPDSPGLLQVFEQVCHAVGFAHSQGIVHRDLKPSNVMVGAFGEVQVMDWGLAKEMRGAECGGRNDGRPKPLAPGLDSALSLTGEAMGTPAYMPPEQARGEWDRVDARADVFALGGILCAVLTDHAPYTGKAGTDLLARAAAGDLGEAFARLDACDAAPGLVGLAKQCLATDPARRPADAVVVGGLLLAYRTAADERAREADRARAVARSGDGVRLVRLAGLEWGRRRPTDVLLLAACTVLAAGLLALLLTR